MVLVLLLFSFGLGITASYLFSLSKKFVRSHSPVPEEKEDLGIVILPQDFSEEIEVALAKERERISKELHDDLMQRLYSVKYSVEFASLFNVPEEVKTCLNLARQGLQSSITLIRFIIEDKMEPNFKTNPLSKLIESICIYSNKSIGWKIVYQNNFPDREFLISDEMKRELCRMIQQALHNANLHALGNTIEVALHWGDILTITIMDNGLGLIRRSVGLGLMALQRRAEKIGALFSFHSLPSGIKITIKVAPPDNTGSIR